MLNCNLNNNSPLTDKDNHELTNTKPSLTVDLALFFLQDLICFETLIPSKFDISVLKFQKLYLLNPKSFDWYYIWHYLKITDCIFPFHHFIFSCHNPCFLFDSFLLFPPFISHLASIYKQCHLFSVTHRHIKIT